MSAITTPQAPEPVPVVGTTISTIQLQPPNGPYTWMRLDYHLAYCRTEQQQQRFVDGLFKMLAHYEKECCP